MKKILSIIVIALLAGAVWFYKYNQTTILQVDLPPAQDYHNFVNNKDLIEDEIVVDIIIDEEVEVEDTIVVVDPPELIVDPPELEEVLVASINLDVPFTSQAPTANWEQPFQDACEEASFLMVDYYYQNKELPSPLTVETSLTGMVAWQESIWGGHFNLTVEDLAEFISSNTDYNTEIVEDLTIDKIKKYLNKGQPLIVPANGKRLANPFFKNGGPEYHMLVIKGYAENKIITNDPGTSRGADFIYTYENILYSIADWNKKESLATGPKRALIVY